MVLLLALLASCAFDAPARTEEVPDGVMDMVPGRRTVAPDGVTEAVVAEGGELRIRVGRNTSETLDEGVDARVAFSPDSRVLVYARLDDEGETNLWRARRDGSRFASTEQLTFGRGSEDRPAFSPDGQRVAFVSGKGGIAAWWSVDAGGNVTQLTNIDLPAHAPGSPPDGFLPVPDGVEYSWDAEGLRWVAAGKEYRVQP